MLLLSRDRSPFRRPAAVVAQRHIHKDVSAGGAEAHHQGFCVLTAFATLLGSVQGWWTNVKVESLVVERGDGVANDLVSQLTNRLAHQIVGLGYFDAGQTGGELYRRSQIHIKNDPPFNLAREANLGSDPFPPVGLFFHAEVLDGNGRLQPLRQDGVGRVNERLNQVHPHDLCSSSDAPRRDSVVTHHVLDDLVENFRLHRFLHEVTGAALQGGHDVLLIADRRHHYDAGVRMVAHDLLRRLDAFHLRHGDIHQNDVGCQPFVLADCRNSVASLADYLSTECFDHSSQVLAGEHGVIHDQIAHRLSVFAPSYGRKLVHDTPPYYHLITIYAPSTDNSSYFRHQLPS